MKPKNPETGTSEGLQAKTIIRELTKILRTIEPIEKKGKNEREGWNYLRILELANSLRKKLFARGIVIIPDDVEVWQSEPFTIEGRQYFRSRVLTQFTLTNGTESLTFASYGLGQSSQGGDLSAAQTMALKAWLKRLGLIFGEKDDQEVGEEWQKFDEPEIIENPKERALRSAMRQCGLIPEQVETIISKRLEQQLSVAAIVELPKKLFDQALESLYAEIPLTAKLEESVKVARAKKAAKSQVQSIDGEQNNAV